MSWTAADKVDRRTAFQAAVATTTLNAAPFIYCWLRDTNPVALFGLAMVLIWIILVVAARLEFDAMATAQRPSQMQTRSKVESLHRRKTSGPELSPVSVLLLAEEPPKTKLPKALQDFHFKTG